MRLEGRKALITGGSRGIGSGIALGLAREGCDVIINYVEHEKAARTVATQIIKIGRKAYVVQADISHVDQVEKLIGESEKLLGNIDILVNNAAITFYEPWSEISERTWDLTLNTNLRGAFFCSQYAARGMIERNIRGSIINLSSTNGRVAETGVLAYNVSKGGVEMLTKSLAVELAPHGIRVNAIAPGLIETEANRSFLANIAFREHYRLHIPLNRLGTIHDCVGAVVFLASMEASYITGESITIDGGLISDQCPGIKVT